MYLVCISMYMYNMLMLMFNVLVCMYVCMCIMYITRVYIMYVYCVLVFCTVRYCGIININIKICACIMFIHTIHLQGTVEAFAAAECELLFFCVSVMLVGYALESHDRHCVVLLLTWHVCAVKRRKR